MSNNQIMLELETRQAVYGSGFGGPQAAGAAGANSSAGTANSDNAVNGLQELIEQYKNNPQELLLLLLYVYLPAKEEGLGNYVGNIGKMLKEEAKFLDKWNDLQADINKLEEDAQKEEYGDQPSEQFKKDFAKYQKDLASFKKEFFDATHSFDGHNKFPVNGDTRDFIDTVMKALDNLQQGIGTDVISMSVAMKGADQTTFKAYMNNFSTGNTAFTSISNYTQEEMQLYGKQYDSGEGLIKSGLKTFTTQEQTMVNNQRSA